MANWIEERIAIFYAISLDIIQGKVKSNPRRKTGSTRGLAGTAGRQPKLAERARSCPSASHGRRSPKLRAPGQLRSRSLVRQLAVVSCTMATLVCARSSCCRRRFWAVGRPKRWTVRCADTTSLSLLSRTLSLSLSLSLSLFVSLSLLRLITESSSRRQISTIAFRKRKQRTVASPSTWRSSREVSQEEEEEEDSEADRSNRARSHPSLAVPPADVQSS